MRVEAEWGETRTKRRRVRGPRVPDVIEFGARERGLRAKRKIEEEKRAEERACGVG
jgi:hypothetical protein